GRWRSGPLPVKQILPRRSKRGRFFEKLLLAGFDGGRTEHKTFVCFGEGFRHGRQAGALMLVGGALRYRIAAPARQENQVKPWKAYLCRDPRPFAGATLTLDLDNDPGALDGR